jgi:hypothetical protein
MKRWVGYFLSGLFVLLVTYKHDVVSKIFGFIFSFIGDFINGLGKLLDSVL